MARGSMYPTPLLALVQSTSYPPIPALDELENLRRTLNEHRQLKRKRDRERDEGQIVVERPSPVRLPKQERSVSPAGSIVAIAPSHPHPITYAGIKKKKKRPLESDDESRSIASPPSHHTTSTSGLKLKLNKSRPLHIDPSPTPTTPGVPTGPTSTYGAHIDFSLPPAPSRPLVPPRQGVQKPPQPGPKRQADVDEDFSNTKAPTQTAQPTFWASVEPYLREIREDDLAMLNFKADAPESYEIPARGRHYTEIWDEEDGLPIGTTPRMAVPSLRHGHHGPAGPSRLVPATELREEHLVEEHKGLGSLSERLIAGLVGGITAINPEASGTNVNKYDGNRDVARVDVVDLEERMKRELKSSILINDQEEHSSLDREDDEVTAALRQCQRLLLEQTQINDARKSRLADIARHRLAYAEYTTSLDGVEKSIEMAWAKRVKKHGSGPKAKSTNGNGDAKPPVSENVKKLVRVRQAWVDTVGKAMKARPRGEVIGIPEASVYEGLGEELDEKVVDEAVELATDEE